LLWVNYRENKTSVTGFFGVIRPVLYHCDLKLVYR
jgi:hypothetical protein